MCLERVDCLCIERYGFLEKDVFSRGNRCAREIDVRVGGRAYGHELDIAAGEQRGQRALARRCGKQALGVIAGSDEVARRGRGIGRIKRCAHHDSRSTRILREMHATHESESDHCHADDALVCRRDVAHAVGAKVTPLSM